MLRRVRQSLRQVLLLMARRPDVLCGAVLLSVLLVLAVKFTYSRAKNVVAAARPPVRFFSAEAPVVDLYLGQLDQVERLRSMAEVSLIFFYAPWCAHSMAARQEVQQVAKKLAKQVQFVAVNCWWSKGKCRRLNRLYQYPVIHVFYRRFGPIEYKGPFVAPYIESFVFKVLTPLTYLPSRTHLAEFLSCHEPRVVGFFLFNSSPQPPGYITYLSSALQALKRDFHGVRFGIVTSKHVAEALSLGEDQTIYLHRRFKASLIFPRKQRNFTSEAVCSWVFEHHETVLQWLQPPGTKSRLLEQELTKGPALLLFVPHNPLSSKPSPILQQVADVAVRYHSCNRSTLNSGFTSHSLCCQSVVLSESTSSVCEVCLNESWPSLPSSSIRCLFPSITQGGEAFQTRIKHCCLHQLPSPVSINAATSVGCNNFLNSYSPFTQFSACCRKVQPQLNESKTKEEPEMDKVNLTPPSSAPPSSASYQEDSSITGLSCRTNRTLRFYLLDLALYWPLAVRLGASSNKNDSLHKDASTHSDGSDDGSFAAIVNLKDEVHYVLHRSPTATLTESLEAFIRNFSAPFSLLQRHLVGEEDRKSDEDAAKHPYEHQRSPPRLLITELTTSSFLPSVMDQQKDVLLFYYTQWCGFCSILNHIIIRLARLLQGNSTVTVARVNVARNDLPWEFMVDHVPSILLFPRYRKHLSVKFPDELPVTLPNLLRFVLKHSGSLRHAGKLSAEALRTGTGAILHEEFLALQQEVKTLHLARERLSQQLAQLWRSYRQLHFDKRSIEESLEKQLQEKSQQLAEALRRLEELVDTSETLLNENTLLRILLKVLKDRTEAKEQTEGETKRTEQKKDHLAS